MQSAEELCAMFKYSFVGIFLPRVNLTSVCTDVWMVNEPVAAYVFQIWDQHTGGGGSFAAR